MVGTFFVTTDFVERPGYLTWAQIAEMADAGMEIAGAQRESCGLHEDRPERAEAPACGAESDPGRAPPAARRFMAYPAGKYNPAVMAATRAAGYEAAVTVLHGTGTSPANAFDSGGCARAALTACTRSSAG